MSWAGAYIVASYLALALFGGTQGLFAVLLHLALMLLLSRLK